jgi:hypothetical protein
MINNEADDPPPMTSRKRRPLSPRSDEKFAYGVAMSRHANDSATRWRGWLAICLLPAFVVLGTPSAGSGFAPSKHPVPRNGSIAYERLEQLSPAGLVSVRAAGGQTSTILAVPEGGLEETAITRDGSRVACVVVRGVEPPDLYTVRSEGTQRVRVAIGDSPTWAPDGSRLAIVET